MENTNLDGVAFRADSHGRNGMRSRTVSYLRVAFALSFDGGGVSSLCGPWLLEGKATCSVSSLSLFAGPPGVAALLVCRGRVPESAVGRSRARLGEDCLRSSPGRGEKLASGAALLPGRRNGATFGEILNGGS
jgi:hypothetical protein